MEDFCAKSKSKNKKGGLKKSSFSNTDFISAIPISFVLGASNIHQ